MNILCKAKNKSSLVPRNRPWFIFFYHSLARIVECVSECIILISKETKPKITRQQQKNKTNNNKKQEPRKAKETKEEKRISAKSNRMRW